MRSVERWEDRDDRDEDRFRPSQLTSEVTIGSTGGSSSPSVTSQKVCRFGEMRTDDSGLRLVPLAELGVAAH